MKILVLISLIIIPSQLLGQWNEDWTSSTNSSAYTTGWISLSANDNESYSFYKVDLESITIMQSPFSETSLYSYRFNEEEIAAGNQIFSIGVDLTGDDIKEFYVLAYHDSEENPRQSFKVIDITNGDIIFAKNDASSFYTYPVIWDVDNDNTLECTFAVYDYPNFQGYYYSVVNTGVVNSLNNTPNQLNKFKLMQNYPNPFNPSTKIKFSTSEPGNVRIRIYDANGELIRRLKNEFMKPGSHSVDWNGTNSNGKRVSSGVYLYTLENKTSIETKKMMIVK